MKTNVRGFLCLFFLIGCICANAQVKLSTLTLNAGGNFFENADFKLTSSIGEMSAVHTSFFPDFILSRGVLQPPVRRITIDSTDIEDLRIFPTLTSENFVYLDARIQEKTTGTLTIYTITGQVIAQRSLNIPAGAYRERILLPVMLRGEYMVEVLLIGDQFLMPLRRIFKVQKL